MSTDAAPDPRHVDEARRQIGGWLAEIATLAEQGVPPAEFFAGCLARITASLHAPYAAVWRLDEHGDPKIETLATLPGAPPSSPALEARRANVVGIVFEQGQPLRVPIQTSGEGAGLLLAAPVRVGESTQLVLDVVQRADTSERAQQNFLRFLVEACDLVRDYLRERQLATLAERDTLARQVSQFAVDVHASLDVTQVAFTIANESRRLLSCDRASVAVRQGHRCRITASSGEEVCDPRSGLVRSLAKLVDAVLTAGDPLWYDGRASDLPPQIDAALNRALDESQARAVAVLPLKAADESATPVGALVLEQFDATPWNDVSTARAEELARHAGGALDHASQVAAVPLLSLWRSLRQMRMMSKTLRVVLAVAAIVAVLAIVPYPFAVHTQGVLQPVERRHVFAALAGVIDRVHVKHGQHVHAGDLLAEMRNTDLEVSITEVTGQHTAVEEQLLAIDRALFDEGNRMSVDERNRLSGQRSELKQRLGSLERQLDLLKLKRDKLRITSPIDGEVTTWNVEELLDHRPVAEGQVLMSVADTSGEWELELRLPENRLGEVLPAARAADRPLAVTYRLATDPGTDHEGTLGETHLAAEVRGDDGNSVLARAAIDRREIESFLRPGAEVTAKVHCGSRSLAYIWLHDAAAFVQSRILFRL